MFFLKCCSGNDMTVTKVGAACLDVYEEEGDLFYEDCSEEIVWRMTRWCG